MTKLRVNRGDVVWVLDTKAHKVAQRNCTDREDQCMIAGELLSAWQNGSHGYLVSYMPLSARHKWIWIHMGNRRLRVHDSEVIRI